MSEIFNRIARQKVRCRSHTSTISIHLASDFDKRENQKLKMCPTCERPEFRCQEVYGCQCGPLYPMATRRNGARDRRFIAFFCEFFVVSTLFLPFCRLLLFGLAFSNIPFDFAHSTCGCGYLRFSLFSLILFSSFSFR